MRNHPENEAVSKKLSHIIYQYHTVADFFNLCSVVSITMQL